MAEKSLATSRALYKYDPDVTLDSGGQAEIFRGLNVDTRQTVAIREIKYDKKNKNSAIWFEREKGHIGKLKHPNIAEPLDYFETADDEGNPLGYIIQEFIDGETLLDKMLFWDKENSDMLEYALPNYVARKSKRKEEYFSIMEQVLNGLEYLHQWEIVHRDISPKNIMITRNHQVKIIDFGISKVLTDPYISDLSHRPTHYSAPEMTKRDGGVTLDIYSAALVFYEMYAGVILTTPNDSGKGYSMPTQNFHDEKLLPHREIPKPLFKVLQKAASEKKEERYQSAGAFKQALVEIRDEVTKPQEPYAHLYENTLRHNEHLENKNSTNASNFAPKDEASHQSQPVQRFIPITTKIIGFDKTFAIKGGWLRILSLKLSFWSLIGTTLVVLLVLNNNSLSENREFVRLAFPLFTMVPSAVEYAIDNQNFSDDLDTILLICSIPWLLYSGWRAILLWRINYQEVSHIKNLLLISMALDVLLYILLVFASTEKLTIWLALNLLLHLGFGLVCNGIWYLYLVKSDRVKILCELAEQEAK